MKENNISSIHRQTYTLVFENDYYLELFNRICESYGGPGESFGLQDPEKICSFWNKFWFQLPDNQVVHRKPFDEICALAEGSYLMPEDIIGE
jgi:hypothetical protein